MSGDTVTRRKFIRKAGSALAAAVLGCRTLAATSGQKRSLNFVFFLIDDLGYSDLGCFGSSFYETPNIDRLASQGMIFTDAYAACPVCSPTRASIMTGKYPARTGITDWIPGQRRTGKLIGPENEMFMKLEEVTLAEAFKEAGYATGFFGKWHLGDKPYRPDKQGFDVNIGGARYGAPGSYFYPYLGRSNRALPGIDSGDRGEYLTDRLTDESLKFLRTVKDSPFLLYLSHYAVHTPLQAKEEMAANFEKKAEELPVLKEPQYIDERGNNSRRRQDHAVYAAMVKSVDESVGRVMKDLEKLKLADSTAVIFMSDNGGLCTLPKRRGVGPTSNLPLRAGKGWLYEGGIREPVIIKWPGVVKPGGKCSVPVTSTDFYPTMLEMAGLKPRPRQHIDGLSIVPLLKGARSLERDAIYWHYPHYHGSGWSPGAAVRCGDYKLIEFYEEDAVELYNLREDLGEQNDLAAEMPEKVAQLRRKLAHWQKSVGGDMPRPNPAYKKQQN